MKKIQFQSDVTLYDHIDDLKDPHALELCHHAIKALEKSYSPYSGYPVGSAVRLQNGHIVTGNNQENAVFPLGLCAERVTLYAASSQYDQPVIAIAIATNDKNPDQNALPAFPCGSCRQVMLEFEDRYDQKIEVYVIGGDGKVITVRSAKELLPFAFSSTHLR